MERQSYRTASMVQWISARALHRLHHGATERPTVVDTLKRAPAGTRPRTCRNTALTAAIACLDDERAQLMLDEVGSFALRALKTVARIDFATDFWNLSLRVCSDFDPSGAMPAVFLILVHAPVLLLRA
eukprot:170794-Prorocentrum_minimum.AAC.2